MKTINRLLVGDPGNEEAQDVMEISRVVWQLLDMRWEPMYPSRINPRERANP